jgi:hypothetical protein
MRAIGPSALVSALALLVLSVSPAPAQDAVVLGCNEQLEGEIGIRELVGSVGEIIEVPVTIHTTGPVDAFRLEVEVPEGVLVYLGTAAGELTDSFSFVGGNWFENPSRVRILGYGTVPIPAGASGQIAVITFQVAAAGSGEFVTPGDEFQDDIFGYIPCAEVHGPNRITEKTWATVKALYQ